MDIKITNYLISMFHRLKLSLVPHLRRPVYLPVGLNSVQKEAILQLMSKVAWDVKEVSTQHSQYVEVLLRVSLNNERS